MNNNILADTLNKYSLTLTDAIRVPDGSMIRSHVVRCVDAQDNDLCLKLFDSTDEEARHRFVKEINSIKLLRKQLPSKYKSWVPSIVKSHTGGVHPFYIYKYIKGKDLGKFIETFGINFGKFGLENFHEFIKFFDAVSDIDAGSLDLGRWGSRTAKKELRYYLEKMEGDLPSDLFNSIHAYFEKNFNKTFRDYELSHRDLYPENVLIEKDMTKKFTFIDWEYFGYVPLGFNAAFLSLMFWREEFWKARVFTYYYNKYQKYEDGKYLKVFTDSFTFCTVVLALRFFYQLTSFAKDDTNDVQNAKRTFLYDLGRALSGEIVRPNNIKFYIDKYNIQKVAEKYGLGEVRDYEVFYASKGNTVAKIRFVDNSKLVFRFYSDSRSKYLINRELKIFKKLRESGIQTCDVLETPQGKQVVEYKLYGKVRRIAALSYVRGQKISKVWANESSANKLGKTLRKIHDCNVTHGDFSKENVLFIKDRITGVIDFEWGRLTSSVKQKEHDLAKAIALWMTDVRSKGISDERFIVAVVKGYYNDKKVSSKKFDHLLDLIISKIQAERDIFLTTLDLSSVKSKASRFSVSIKVIHRLKSYSKDKRTF